MEARGSQAGHNSHHKRAAVTWQANKVATTLTVGFIFLTFWERSL